MSSNLVPQFSCFLVVGAVTTCIDFGGYNILTALPFRWRRIPASLLSSTIAMVFSFIVNGALVFQGHEFHWLKPIKFLAVTCASSYGIQSIVLFLLSGIWRTPVDQLTTAMLRLPTGNHWSREFVAKNVAKAVAVLSGLVWNFAWYRYFVFR